MANSQNPKNPKNPKSPSGSPIFATKDIDEGDCLRFIDSLPEIKHHSAKHVVYLKYSTSPEHVVFDEDDGDESSQAGAGHVHFEMMYINKLSSLHTDGQNFQSGVFPMKDFGSVQTEDVRVLYFGKCNIEFTKKLVDAVQKQETHRTSTANSVHLIDRPPSFLDSPHLKRHQGFVTGISLRATFKPKRSLIFFVAIPYLGITKSKHRGAVTESLSLDQYKHLQTEKHGNGSRNADSPRVFQAWFCLFDNARIALFKSAEDKFSNRGPLFAFQYRLGAFHALIQMISNIFSPIERYPLESFRTTVAGQLASYMELNSEAKLSREYISTAINDFEQSLTDLATMISVIQYQMKILGDLREIFENQKPKGQGKPYGNAVKLPFIADQPEQTKAVLQSIDASLEERFQFREELRGWLAELRIARASKETTLRMVEPLQEQVTLAQSMEKSLKLQGQTISVFTLITTTFMPLGFLASYFAMIRPEWKGSIFSRLDFWKISGPVTVGIMLMMLLFLWIPDDAIKEQIKKIPVPTCSWGKKYRTSKSKSDSHA